MPNPKEKKIRATMESIHQKMSPFINYTRESWRVWLAESFHGGYHSADDFRAAMVDSGSVEEILSEGKGNAKSKIFRKINSFLECLQHHVAHPIYLHVLHPVIYCGHI